MPVGLRRAWYRTLGAATAVLGAAAAAGWLAGHPWAMLAFAALALLAWHLWRLRRVLRRLDTRRRVPPATGAGAWDALDDALHDAQAGMHARKRRLLAMLRAYRAASAALPDAIVAVERDSQRVAWFNAAATRLLGLRYPADIDAPVGDRLQPLPMARWLAMGRHAEPMFDVASPVDPSVRLQLRLLPYSETLWLLLVRDVTKLVRLEHMRGDFVANVSHELRTPLTVVHGYLDLVDPDAHPDLAPMLRELQRQSLRMTRLVEDLLTLSRLEARDHLDEEPVPMAPMLAALRREAEALSQGRHAVAVADEAGVDLLGSPPDLHSAFSNLVANAVRYTPAGGTITITFRLDGDDPVLSVRDTGLGIPAAHLPRLTERFYRVSASRSRESGGTGLGLAIAKHVLGLHQARLEIRSTVGAGSEFACRFGPGRACPRDAP